MTPLCFVSLQPCRVWTIDLPELIPVISGVVWLGPELMQGKLLIYSTEGGMRWDSKDTVTHEKKNAPCCVDSNGRSALMCAHAQRGNVTM